MVLLCYLLLNTVHTATIVPLSFSGDQHQVPLGLAPHGHQHVNDHQLVVFLHQIAAVLPSVVAASSLVCVRVDPAQGVWLAVV